MQPDCSLKAEEELTGRGDCFKTYKDFFTSSQRGFAASSIIPVHQEQSVEIMSV